MNERPDWYVAGVQPSPRSSPATLAGDAQSRLGTAHERFARAALLIYLGSALVSVTLLFVSAITDRDHETREIVHQFDLQNQLRAQYVAEHMSLLESELGRLARRDEVNLEDQDMGPEKSLLDFTHRQSAFFNAGVGLIGADGKVLYSEPEKFLPAGGSLGSESWFATLGKIPTPQIVPAHPSRTDDALLYVLAPIDRGGRFEGALVGGLDLAR
ncbi:MAG TPA: cache domain-containing protein, partial [bacterium]|nr:cache domain-containing protein [bacterium]